MLLENALVKFKNLELSKYELTNILNNNLKVIKISEPIIVYASDVIKLLESYRSGKITADELLDWVNTIWFTDLFDYYDSQSDSIASVMNELEEVDENIDKLSASNIVRYITVLSNNMEL
jgi:hypothetical protein